MIVVATKNLSFGYRAILHDENVYPDPLSFKPERFLTGTGELNPSVQNPFEACFGFGRRWGFLLRS